MARNLATRLRCRSVSDPMARYDRLPPGLRRWLAGAALPWSPHSALKLWKRAERAHPGDPAAVLARLDQAEARLLARDPLTRGPLSSPRRQDAR